MSHLARYHGYSISSANSIKYDQLLTIFCTCTTKWLFCALGHSFLALKGLYSQEASTEQKQNCSCCRLLDKLCRTFLWYFAQTSSTITVSFLLSNWLVNCYILWVLPWKSCPFSKQGHIALLCEGPSAAGIRPRHPGDTRVRGSHSCLHPVLVVVGLRNVFALGLFAIPYIWVLSYEASQDWGPSWVGRVVQ